MPKQESRFMVLNNDVRRLSGPISSNEAFRWPMFRPWALSSLLCVMMFIAPAGAQQASPTVAAADPPSFEVASIKLSNPDKTSQDFDVSNERVSLRNYTLRQ